MYFFEGQSTFLFEVQGMAQHNIVDYDCGPLAMTFMNELGETLDADVFDDGLNSQASSVGQKTFTIYSPTRADLIDAELEVTYRVYLENYPSR